MSGFGVQNILLEVSITGIAFFVVPAVLWVLVVGGGIVSGRSRTFTFLAAVVVGGLGAVMMGLGAWSLVIDPTPDDAWPSQALAAVLPMLGGAGLLLIGALIGFIGFVAHLLRQYSVSAEQLSIGGLIGGQPKSEDSVDSNGHGDQESDV